MNNNTTSVPSAGFTQVL